MQAFFEFLKAQPYILLFFTVGMAVLVGKFNVKGYGLGMVAAAVVVGCALATWASTYGVKLQLDNFAKSLFYYLFMYGVGLRVGPSFFNSLKKDGIKFTVLAVLCSIMGLVLVVGCAKMFGLPPGAAGGILAGSQTMSAAIGTAEMAVTQGAYKVPEGSTAEAVSAMIALGYGVTYIWGTVGIILICKYLPRWWGLDARKAAKDYEKAHGVANVDDSGLTGYRPAGLRAYKLENKSTAGQTIAQFRQQHPEYRIVNVVRNDEAIGADPHIMLQVGDVVALGGRLEALTAKMGLLGTEVDDAKALNIPLDQAEILVTDKKLEGKALKEFRNEDFAGQLQIVRLERGGVPIPLGADTQLQRFDVLFVAGLKSAVNKLAALMGKVARPSTATDLLTLSSGMILGLLIGQINIPAGSFSVGLGNAGGLLLSGIIVSSLVSRLRFFGNTPNAARNVLEDLGLVTFIAIVGINAGATLLAQLTGKIALFIFLAGFIASTIPPIITWAIGYHIMKINPAVLMGGVAGARSHSGPAREASKEIDSSVPWVGFPVGYAVSGVLLTVFGYFAMIFSKQEGRRAMGWLEHTLTKYPELAVYLAVGVGYWVGSWKFRGFSLGGATGSLLVGLFIGALVKVPVASMAKAVLFLLFMFSIGYSVGPKFFKAMKGQGWRFGVIGVFVPVVGLLTAFVVAKILHLDVGFAGGLVSGALTESPAIGTATEAIQALQGIPDDVRHKLVSHVAIADALCYVFGAFGVIYVCGTLGPKLLGIDLRAEAELLEKQYGVVRTRAGIASAWQPFEVRAYRLKATSPLVGQTVAQAEEAAADKRLFVQRIRRGGELLPPKPEMVLEADDLVAVSGRREVLVNVLGDRGAEVDDRELLDIPIASYDVFLSNKKLAGRTLEEIVARHDVIHSVFLRKITRGTLEIPIGTRTTLERGDVLSVVGPESAVERVSKFIGTIVRPIDTTDFIAVGLTIFIGALLGAMIFVQVGGTKIFLGTSVGTLLAGVVTGYIRSIRPLFGRVPDSAVAFMQSIGLSGFVAMIGLGAGPEFIPAVREAGIGLLIGGVFVTLVPQIAGLYFGRYVLKANPLLVLGALAGAQTFTPGLAAVQEKSGSPIAVLGYTGAMPVDHVLLTTWGSVIVLLMSR